MDYIQNNNNQLPKPNINKNDAINKLIYNQELDFIINDEINTDIELFVTNKKSKIRNLIKRKIYKFFNQITSRITKKKSI